MSLTAAAIYLGHNSLSSTSTSIISLTFTLLSVSNETSGILRGLLSTVATSLAMPSTLLQSDLLAVTPMSSTTSSLPSTTFISVPSGYFSPFIIKIPCTLAPTYSDSVSLSSSPEQSIPLDGTPLSLPFLISCPVGSNELSKATGTKSPFDTFCAPVTICTSSFPPTSI